MPDVDRLLDTLVDEVRASTQAPGAPKAIRQANRRRLTAAATGALTLVAVAGALAALTAGGNDRLSLIEQPAAPSPENPVEQESADGRRLAEKSFENGVGKTLTGVPGWTLNDSGPEMLRPCAGEWASNASGSSGGNFDVPTAGARWQVWSQHIGFWSAAQAADAVAALAENLASCSTLEWRVQPIAQTEAVLASSWLGVVWIYQEDTTVATLEVPTADGPPPLTMQVDIANLISSSIG